MPWCHDSVGHFRSACWVLHAKIIWRIKTILLWAPVPSPLVYSHILISIISTPMGEFRSWLPSTSLPPLKKSSQSRCIEFFVRPFFPSVFSFQWFSNHFQIFQPFPPSSASKHPLSGKEHSGGLWLTNLCSQRCLWAMGSQHGRRVVPHYGWVCLKIGVPQNEWFTDGKSY